MFEIIVRSIIRDSGGKFLFVKRAKDPEKNKWSLPGGKIEHFEKAEDAIVREIKEELNLDFIRPKFLSTPNTLRQSCIV